MDELDHYKRHLIKFVRNHPILWDPKHGGYKNKEKRKEVWDFIDNALGSIRGSDETAKTIWSTLTRSFANALNRKKSRSVRGLDVKEWLFEKDMMFLIPAKEWRKGGRRVFELDKDCCDSTCTRRSQDSDKEGPSTTGIIPLDLDCVCEDHTAVPCNSRFSADVGDNSYHEDRVDNNMSEESSTSDDRDIKPQEKLLRSLVNEKQAATWKRQPNATEIEETNAKRKRDDDSELNRKRDEGDLNMKRVESLSDPSRQVVQTAEELNALNFELLELMRAQREEKERKENESTRLIFFKSIMPRVDALSEEHFLDFQIGVLQLLKSTNT